MRSRVCARIAFDRDRQQNLIISGASGGRGSAVVPDQKASGSIRRREPVPVRVRVALIAAPVTSLLTAQESRFLVR